MHHTDGQQKQMENHYTHSLLLCGQELPLMLLSLSLHTIYFQDSHDTFDFHIEKLFSIQCDFSKMDRSDSKLNKMFCDKTFYSHYYHIEKNKP